jgi:hypothetical protein
MSIKKESPMKKLKDQLKIAMAKVKEIENKIADFVKKEAMSGCCCKNPVKKPAIKKAVKKPTAKKTK